MESKAHICRIRVPKSESAFWYAVFEGHSHLLMVSTLDRKPEDSPMTCLLECLVPEGQWEDAKSLIDSLCRQGLGEWEDATFETSNRDGTRSR